MAIRPSSLELSIVLNRRSETSAQMNHRWPVMLERCRTQQDCTENAAARELRTERRGAGDRHQLYCCWDAATAKEALHNTDMRLLNYIYAVSFILPPPTHTPGSCDWDAGRAFEVRPQRHSRNSFPCSWPSVQCPLANVSVGTSFVSFAAAAKIGSHDGESRPAS